MNMFVGKVALVTGGSSGIGRATALAFAKEGAKVVVASRHSIEGEETVRLIKQKDSEALFIKTDVTKAAQVEALVNKTVETFGHLDIAFNNAGVEGKISPIIDQTEESWDAVIDTNLKGVWLSMKYEIPQMLKQVSGRIVNVSSTAGLVGFAGVSPYVASKHGVLGLTKSVALEYAYSNIRINAVSPSATETDLLNRFTGGSDEVKAKFAAMHPLERFGKPEEIAEAAIWLCSDKTAFITGQSLTIDGGYTIQ